MLSKGNGLNLPYVGKSVLVSVKLLVLAGDLIPMPRLGIY